MNPHEQQTIADVHLSTAAPLHHGPTSLASLPGDTIFYSPHPTAVIAPLGRAGREEAMGRGNPYTVAAVADEASLNLATYVCIL